MKLRSNTILITGGGSGIGYELTKQLTALGNTILITGRDQAKMDRAKADFPKIHTFRSDVSDPKAIATLYEEVTRQFPELNTLINNAGIMREINIHDKAGSLEDITRQIEINLSGPIRMVKQFLPHLKTKSEAAIMNVSSGLAFVPLPTSPVYCATKSGLYSFTESLRVQLKNTKVKVFDLASAQHIFRQLPGRPCHRQIQPGRREYESQLVGHTQSRELSAVALRPIARMRG